MLLIISENLVNMSALMKKIFFSSRKNKKFFQVHITKILLFKSNINMHILVFKLIKYYFQIFTIYISSIFTLYHNKNTNIYINKRNIVNERESVKWRIWFGDHCWIRIKRDIRERTRVRITNRRVITANFMLNESCNVDLYYSFTKRTCGHLSLINMRKRITKFY